MAPLNKQYFVYIMSSTCNAILYVGVTNNLFRRVFEHRSKMTQGFTATYHVTKLVYFEETSDIISAISREKQLKNWARAKKKRLIEMMNPYWKDLVEDLI
jgi:putative endonuclease